MMEIRIMMYSDGHESWRAACLTDGQNDLCLTGPELAHLDDNALLAAAQNARELISQCRDHYASSR